MTPSHKVIAMNLDSVLYDLGVRGETLSDDEKQFLDEEGYLPLPDMMTPAQVTLFGDRWRKSSGQKGRMLAKKWVRRQVQYG